VIAFGFDGSDGQLVVSSHVLDHFRRHQQSHWRHAEAGGQLFARLTPYEIFVEGVTGPRSSDIRSRFSYVADRKLERKEILEGFLHGLHYVGDWHTHPERAPVPSRVDQATMAECSRRSLHRLGGFLLVVVGNGVLPGCLNVSFYPSRNKASGPIVLKPRQAFR
jgi:integrative and conjugative element protein (TIGR02256 family)